MTSETLTNTIQRRDFLKLMGAGLASLWLLSASSAPLTAPFVTPHLLAEQVSFGSRLLRGTQDGQIFQSLDQGQTWQVLASFGSHCAIRDLVSQNGQLYASLALAGHTFWISTADALTWRTLG